MAQPERIEVQGRSYRVTFEQAIIAGRRRVVATAYDDRGVAIRQHEMNTSSAKSYLERDTAEDPPSWEEMKRLALSLLQIELEE